MMKVKCVFGSAAVAACLLTGCATPISMAQKQELRAYEAKGLVVEEKSPGAAAGLGLLPGGGSFYTRNYGLGIVNLLFWPLSILWDPVSGYNGAESINYYATKTSVQTTLQKETSSLERSLEEGSMTREQYLRQKRELEDKYAPSM
jgi:hypothetical protein